MFHPSIATPTPLYAAARLALLGLTSTCVLVQAQTLPVPARDPVKVVDRSATLTDTPQTLLVPVGRWGDKGEAVTFRYRTQADSAAAGTAFVATEGSATIRPGARAVGVPVTVQGQPAADRVPGKFALRIDRAIATSGQTDTLEFSPINTAAFLGSLWAMAPGDFNGDGKIDLAAANFTTSKVEIFANTTSAPGADTAFVPTLSLDHVAAPDKPAVCDLNQDGRPDIVAATANTNRMSVYLNTTAPGSATFSFARTDLTSLPWGYMQQTACADFDGDGRMDVVGAGFGSRSSSGSNRAIVFRNLTEPGATAASLAAPVGFAAHPTSSFSRPTMVVAGDFDGDGRPDIALGNADTRDLTVLLNTTVAGSGQITFATPTAFPIGEPASDMAVLDIDDDGKLDIVTANGVLTGGATWTLLINRSSEGSASFSTHFREIGGIPFGLAVGDMDLDGRPDVLVSMLGLGNTVNDGVQVLLNRTTPGSDNPSFLLSASVPSADEPHAIAMGDFNQDGLPDFVTGGFVVTAVPLRIRQQQREHRVLVPADPTGIVSLKP
jgi:hypothetical protein